MNTILAEEYRPSEVYSFSREKVLDVVDKLGWVVTGWGRPESTDIWLNANLLVREGFDIERPANSIAGGNRLVLQKKETA